jgi:hypothetical protein
LRRDAEPSSNGADRSPTRTVVSGPTLESAMREVRARHGSRARVVEASRVRTGGVGGFFATEHVEVVVDLAVPDAGPTGRSEPGTAVMATTPAPGRARLGALLRRSARDAHADGIEAGDAPVDRVLAAAVHGRGMDDGAGEAGRGGRWLPSDPGGRDLVPSTERPDFAQVLAQVTRGTQRGAPGPAIAIDLVDGTLDLTTPMVTSPGRTAPAMQTDEDLGSPRRIPVFVPPWRSRPATNPTRHPNASAASTPVALPPALAPAVAEGPGTPPGHAGSVPGTQRSQLASPIAPRLATALDNVRRVPALAPLADVVVMVIDDSPATDRVVARVAFDLDVPPEGIIDLRVVGDAAGLAAVAARRSLARPSVVVVAAPSPFHGEAIVELTEDLRPNQVIAVTEASRSTDELATLSRRVGGIDVVSLHGITHAEDGRGGPWHLLATGIPLGWLDGRRTSPALWARLSGEPRR